MTILFTPASILDLLNQIDELKDYDLGITETLDGNLQLQVGTLLYEITPENPEEIEVEESIVDSVEEANQDAYEDLIESEGFQKSDNDTIEAGLIKEAIKSMLLGGAIKLVKKLM